ncbi:MAG TPA: DJ-1/PfpI family protein [Longimicrobium sp.]|nr:DJ-1/PfpI family protein [Longimicrobium sp.]
MRETVTIGAVVYDNVNMLDLVGMHEPLGWLNVLWPGHQVELLVVAEDATRPVTAARGIQIVPRVSFAACPKLDVLLVPGGTQGDVERLTRDEALIGFIRDRAAEARWVCSVCVGSLLLAAAGVLRGKRATSHWLALGQLAKPEWGVRVVNGFPRFVIDGNVITAGGVASGLDAVLPLIHQLTGDENIARQAQLVLQYHPSPIYDDGDPAVADPDVYFSLLSKLAPPRPAPPMLSLVP